MYITVKEAATKLGVHRQTIYNWIRKGFLPKFQPSPRHRIFIPENCLTQNKLISLTKPNQTTPDHSTPSPSSPDQLGPNQSVPNQTSPNQSNFKEKNGN